MADRSLVVRLVGDERDLIRAYGKAERSTKDFGNTTEQVSKKSKRQLSGLAKVGAGFAAGFVATEGLNQLRNAVNAAAESQRVLTQTRVALESTGKSWDRYGEQIEQTVAAQSRLGFDDEALLQSFANFQRTTQDVGKALKLNNLAMDIARARSISLEQAAQLVTKASLGQAGALRRVGIDAGKATKPVDLLRILTEKYGGSAKAAADDASTANERLAVALENVQESIGTLLLPLVSDLATELSGAADSASKMIENLRNIRNVKIPVINIPIGVIVPGADTTAGKIIRRVFGEINPVTGRASPIGALRTIRQAGDLVGGGDERAPAPSTAVTPRRASIQPFTNVTIINLDGQQIAKVTKKYNERDVISNPAQKRGGNWRR